MAVVHLRVLGFAVNFYGRFATAVVIHVCIFQHESLLRFFIFQFQFFCFVPTNNNNRYDYIYKKKLLTSTVYNYIGSAVDNCITTLFNLKNDIV